MTCWSSMPDGVALGRASHHHHGTAFSIVEAMIDIEKAGGPLEHALTKPGSKARNERGALRSASSRALASRFGTPIPHPHSGCRHIVNLL